MIYADLPARVVCKHGGWWLLSYEKRSHRSVHQLDRSSHHSLLSRPMLKTLLYSAGTALHNIVQYCGILPDIVQYCAVVQGYALQ